MKRIWSKVLDLGAFWLIVVLAYVVVGFLRGRWLARALWWSLHRDDDPSK